MKDAPINLPPAPWGKYLGLLYAETAVAYARAAVLADRAERGNALQIVHEQAEDAGLWFNARTAPEAYLQQELRRLHDAVENAAPSPAEPPAEDIHSCSYYCERPECIKAQRDELVKRMEAAPVDEYRRGYNDATQRYQVMETQFRALCESVANVESTKPPKILMSVSADQPTAAVQQEPVAEVLTSTGGAFDQYGWGRVLWLREIPPEGAKLYTHPSADLRAELDSWSEGYRRLAKELENCKAERDQLRTALADVLPYAEAAIGPTWKRNPPSDSVILAARAALKGTK